jgi:hypothetical protein
VKSSPHSPRQAAELPPVESQRERSDGHQTEVDQMPSQEDTDSTAAVPERPPSPVIPRHLDALQSHWDKVLAELSWAGHGQIQALLRSCSPVAVDDRLVVVAARYDFHRTRLAGDEARRAIEKTLARLLGEPVELQVVLADETEPPAPSQTARGQDDTSLSLGLPSELADDPLVRVAVQELGAVVREL